MRLLIGCMVFLWLGCSTQGTPYTPSSVSSSPGRTGAGSSGAAGPTVVPGGNLAPLPSAAPANSYPTTTGGYFTLQKVIQANVAAGESFIGAAVMGERPFFLFQRSTGGGLFTWDLFELIGETSFTISCSMPAPVQGQGIFRNLGYDGTALVVLSSSDSQGLSLYHLDPDRCLASFDRKISSVPVYWSAPLVFSGNEVFTDNNGILEEINLNTNLVTLFRSQNLPLAGSSLNPDNSTLASDGAFQLWAVSASTALWTGDIYGLWKGWAPLPYATYPELNYVQRILVGSQGKINLVTLSPSSTHGTLSVFMIDASHF